MILVAFMASQVANVVSAIVQAGFVGGTNYQLPAKSRWLSMFDSLGGELGQARSQVQDNVQPRIIKSKGRG